jgi:hypothetical protein
MEEISKGVHAILVLGLSLPFAFYLFILYIFIVLFIRSKLERKHWRGEDTGRDPPQQEFPGDSSEQ